MEKNKIKFLFFLSIIITKPKNQNYNKIMLKLLIYSNLISLISSGSLLDQYLTHHWTFSNGSMADAIGHVQMQQGLKTTFSLDRFGNANSALNLNGGWAYVPAGVYFSSPQFTISVWVFPLNVSTWARVIDFSHANNYEIVLALRNGAVNYPVFQLINSTAWQKSTYSSMQLQPDQWQFLVATFDGTLMNIYLNGLLASNTTFNYELPVIRRDSCYIGKSMWTGNGYSYSYLDDLKFYNKSLTQSEISAEFLQSVTCTQSPLDSDSNRYLSHYWSFSNGSMVDLIGDANMRKGPDNLAGFVRDRFGIANSALNLNGGYTYVPPGRYFNTREFTITAWICPLSVGFHGRFIDFSNGSPYLDNLIIFLNANNDLKPAGFYINSSVNILSAFSTISLIPSQWQFYAVTHDGSYFKMYQNGILTVSLAFKHNITPLIRTSNYFGSCFGSCLSKSYLDDIRFFNKSLTLNEIQCMMYQHDIGNS